MTRSIQAALAAAALLAVPALALAQHDHAQHATTATGTATAATGAIEVSVTGEGFVPARIAVKKGQKVKLLVTRKTERTCATEIVIKDLGINQKLPLGQAVAVEFTPTKSGQLRYACGMDMISGVLVVE